MPASFGDFLAHTSKTGRRNLAPFYRDSSLFLPQRRTVHDENSYYLIDTSKLIQNLEKIAYVREKSGAKALLALKCFATWSVFDLMRGYMDGTTSSSLFETRLGHEQFGGETHAYSVAYDDNEIDEVASYANKIIFNSISQLERYAARAAGRPCGLRLNHKSVRRASTLRTLPAPLAD